MKCTTTKHCNKLKYSNIKGNTAINDSVNSNIGDLYLSALDMLVKLQRPMLTKRYIWTLQMCITWGMAAPLKEKIHLFEIIDVCIINILRYRFRAGRPSICFSSFPAVLSKRTLHQFFYEYVKKRLTGMGQDGPRPLQFWWTVTHVKDHVK